MRYLLGGRVFRPDSLSFLGVGLLFCGLFAQAQELTSENDPRLRRGLEKFPEADVNGDGVLTETEAEAFQSARRDKKKPTQKRSTKKRNPSRCPVPAQAAGSYEARRWSDSKGQGLRYWLLQPVEYDSNRRYPLVLCLHGRGGKTEASQVLASKKFRQRYPAFVVVPVASQDNRWAAPTSKTKDSRGSSISAVFEILTALQKEFSIDPERLYVTGQSMGGFGSFGAVAQRPDLFAAAAPIAGGWTPEDAQKMTKTAFWVFHGDADPTVKVTNSRRMVEALRAVGASVRYTEYAHVKHNSWSRTYASPELWAWLFKQRKRVVNRTENGQEKE